MCAFECASKTIDSRNGIERLPCVSRMVPYALDVQSGSLGLEAKPNECVSRFSAIDTLAASRLRMRTGRKFNVPKFKQICSHILMAMRKIGSFEPVKVGHMQSLKWQHSIWWCDSVNGTQSVRAATWSAHSAKLKHLYDSVQSSVCCLAV